ncbi:hypothetical protein [Cyanobium sp. CH-040]|uniref:hypothetical protein n=1 Tax=Cyanobium sp. CH-040 TaxID=2823708 RepID=UPI0020CC7382|nr:hypothetical protein [Cyanobium sp. CH-040]
MLLLVVGIMQRSGWLEFPQVEAALHIPAAPIYLQAPGAFIDQNYQPHGLDSVELRPRCLEGVHLEVARTPHDLVVAEPQTQGLPPGSGGLGLAGNFPVRVEIPDRERHLAGVWLP